MYSISGVIMITACIPENKINRMANAKILSSKNIANCTYVIRPRQEKAFLKFLKYEVMCLPERRPRAVN